LLQSASLGLLQAATRDYQPSANALALALAARLRGKVACATGCCSATVIVHLER
jgi:hypothetical protein